MDCFKQALTSANTSFFICSKAHFSNKGESFQTVCVFVCLSSFVGVQNWVLYETFIIKYMSFKLKTTWKRCLENLQTASIYKEKPKAMTRATF